MGPKRVAIGSAITVAAVCGALLAHEAGKRLIVQDSLRTEGRIAVEFAEGAFGNYEEALRRLTSAEAVDGKFCSESDLLRLRRLVFESSRVKDIGRLRDRKLVCTTSVGRLHERIDVGPPNFISPRGIQWYINDELTVTRNERALILQSATTNIVVDPSIFADFEHPDLSQAVLAIDPVNGEIFHVTEGDLPIPRDVIETALSQGPRGRFQQENYVGVVACHSDGVICMVFAQDKAALLGSQRGLLSFIALLGGLTAIGFGGAASAVAARRTGLATRLRRAIKRGDLHVEYQPQIDFRTNTVVGAEALVRWIEKDGARHRPDRFVELAENEGFIGELTAFVVRRTIEDLTAIMKADPTFAVSVNFSSDDLNDSQMLDLVTSSLNAAGLAPSQFTFELTERAAGDSPRVKDTLAAVRACGHRVAIDDFGVGYSSLSYLQTMPVDYLKIDKSFTDTIGTDAITATIVPQIVDMARILGLGIVVEGIETADQVAYLRNLDVSVGQGWAFAKPMPAEQLADWLARPLGT